MGTAGQQEVGNVLSFSAEEFDRRHRDIRELMQLRGIDCLVISEEFGYPVTARPVGEDFLE